MKYEYERDDVKCPIRNFNPPLRNCLQCHLQIRVQMYILRCFKQGTRESSALLSPSVALSK